MLTERQTQKRREKIITLLIASAIALALIGAFVAVIKKSTTSPAGPSSRTKISLDVQYFLFKEGYTTPVVYIKNLQDMAWNNCEVKLNDSYIFNLGEIPPMDEDADVILISTNSFVRGDGAVLRPSLDPVRAACIICRLPIYSSYCGNFTRN